MFLFSNVLFTLVELRNFCGCCKRLSNEFVRKLILSLRLSHLITIITVSVSVSRTWLSKTIKNTAVYEYSCWANARVVGMFIRWEWDQLSYTNLHDNAIDKTRNVYIYACLCVRARECTLFVILGFRGVITGWHVLTRVLMLSENAVVWINVQLTIWR